MDATAVAKVHLDASWGIKSQNFNDWLRAGLHCISVKIYYRSNIITTETLKCWIAFDNTETKSILLQKNPWLPKKYFIVKLLKQKVFHCMIPQGEMDKVIGLMPNKGHVKCILVMVVY